MLKKRPNRHSGYALMIVEIIVQLNNINAQNSLTAKYGTKQMSLKRKKVTIVIVSTNDKHV